MVGQRVAIARGTNSVGFVLVAIEGGMAVDTSDGRKSTALQVVVELLSGYDIAASLEEAESVCARERHRLVCTYIAGK